MYGDVARNLPVSIEAEQSVLGSILLNPTSFEDIAGLITEEDFSVEEHKQIFISMRSMFMMSKEIDIITLINNLVENGVYNETGGKDYIMLLAKIVPTAANIKDYAKIIKDKALLRKLINACNEISDVAYSEQGKAEETVDMAEQKIFDIAEKRSSKEFRHIRDIMHGVYSDLERLSENKDMISGSKTGFSGLDKVLVQMGLGDLVLIGARPGMGKTSFAMNIAVNVAKQSRKTVCVFSLEMSGEQLVTRMLSSEALVDSYALRGGNLTGEDWGRIAQAAGELTGCDILIDDTSGVSVTDMKSKLRRVKNLGLVVIDYLQLMQSGRNIENRVQEVGDISRNLKIMAKDLGVPIICCAQLSRGPESRTVKKPMLSDLRDSGAIEQDADIVMFLYREEYYKDQSDAKKVEQEANTAEVIVAKNRHGSTGSVKMGWIGQFTKFRTLDEESGEGAAK
ncbi:MAG: replicative DNA helicase [Ruminococcaceae bacterium]|nr:replicative DNA helicase [Oscillospiraceae bacterium]